MMHDDAYFVISKEVYVLILYLNHFKIQLLYSPLELFLGCIFHISNQISWIIIALPEYTEEQPSPKSQMHLVDHSALNWSLGWGEAPCITSTSHWIIKLEKFPLLDMEWKSSNLVFQQMHKDIWFNLKQSNGWITYLEIVYCYWQYFYTDCLRLLARSSA